MHFSLKQKLTTLVVMLYVTWQFLLVASFRYSNFSRSSIKCHFVICVVFILSGTPINPQYGFACTLFYLISSFDKCFFLDCFPYFFKGTNCSTILSLSYFRMFQHTVAVLVLSIFPQSSYAKYFLIYLYIYLYGSFSCIHLYCYFLILF